MQPRPLGLKLVKGSLRASCAEIFGRVELYMPAWSSSPRTCQPAGPLGLPSMKDPATFFGAARSLHLRYDVSERQDQMEVIRTQGTCVATDVPDGRIVPPNISNWTGAWREAQVYEVAS